jgi:MFS transporter, PAT family, solute carrier family 33 (acetyl-CoA transportor), member 1
MQQPEKPTQQAPAEDLGVDERNELVLPDISLDGPQDEYTTMFCNKPPSVNQTKFMFLVLFFCVGAIQSFQNAIILDLQEKGASFEDQSNFSFVYYPYIFKIFLAPLIDMYFFEKVGRCRTWIVSSCLLIAIGLLVTAPFADRLMHPDHMTVIIVLWFCLNILAVFFLVAGEMWVVKALHGADKGVGSLIFDIGFSIGGFISYNLFVPLSSLKWLNENIFKSNPLSRPLILPSEMMWLMAGIHLVFGLWILLMVAEKKTEHLHERMSFKRLFRLIPQLFINKHLRGVLIVIALQRGFRNLIVDSIGLKFVDYNMSKATIANTDTYSFPFIFLVA